MTKQDHDSVKMYRIRKMLEEISQKSGRGTELITVYIPYNRQLHEVIGTLQVEQGTASNIKSDLTRTHVVSSLGKVVQRLKMYKKTPKRGLVVFCGVLPPEGGGPLGSETLKIYEIDPPKELKQYLYRCDDHFHVDILKDMLRDEAAIGFLAIDSKEAGWGLLRGDKLETLSRTGSGVAGKHRQGGQSAKRFQRLREMEMTYYFNRVANTTRELFLDIHKIRGLIVSGPGPTKEDFVNGGYLEYRLQKMILATIDASYSGDVGIREAADKASNVLSDFRMIEEKDLIQKLFREINTGSGLAAYGLRDVIHYTTNSVADMVLVADTIDEHVVTGKCRRCGNTQERILKRVQVIPAKSEMEAQGCAKCRAMEVKATEQDIVDYLSLLCAKTGATIEVISGRAEHGMMLDSIGQVAAILRYNPTHSQG